MKDMNCLNRFVFSIKNLTKKKVKIYHNNHPIDNFVDNYWMSYCTK